MPRDCKSITIQGGEAQFEVIQSDSFSGATGELTVTGGVQNTGSVEGEATVRLTFDGEELDSETITVPAGANQQIQFTVTGLEPGRSGQVCLEV